MKLRNFLFLFLLLLCDYTQAQGGDVNECQAALKALESLVSDPEERQEIREAFAQQLETTEVRTFTRGYCLSVEENCKSKLASKLESVRFQSRELIRTTIKYEDFRLRAVLSSGVSPKRYFGFLDEQGKSAGYEKELKRIAAAVANYLNAYSLKTNSELRVTPKEIIVTHLAEGGALLFTDEFEAIDRIHPVRHMGLDDYRIGFDFFPGLLEEIDKRFHTRLGSLRVHIGAKSFLLRPMTFRESVLATAVMYLYEKELTRRYRKVEKRSPLMDLPLNEQFIHTSLVYNSGILFSDERVKQILEFSTADYLLMISSENRGKRAPLPLLSTSAVRARLAMGAGIPRQLTSWSAVYHILQRYGAWAGLEIFSDVFDQRGNVSEFSNP